MIDVKNHATFLVADNCTRSGEQIRNSDGSAYIGTGELLIVDEHGDALETSDITSSTNIEKIRLVLRPVSGTDGMHSSPYIYGKHVTHFGVKKYSAAVQEKHVVSIDTVENNTDYILRIRDQNTRDNSAKSVMYTSDGTATAAEISAGLASAINSTFSTDDSASITAEGELGNSSDKLVITGSAFSFNALTGDEYNIQRFNVQTEFDSTITNNKTGSLSTDGITADQATKGVGTYSETASLEWHSKAFQVPAANSKANPNYPINWTELEANSTDAPYDYLVINWENPTHKSIHGNVNSMGSVILALPTTDNGSNQQANIVKTLNDYFNDQIGLNTSDLTLT